MKNRRSSRQISEKRKSQGTSKSTGGESETIKADFEESNENKLDVKEVSSDQLLSTGEMTENSGRNHQKQSKRKTNSCEEASDAKIPKTSKNNLTPESLPPAVSNGYPFAPLHTNTSFDDDFLVIRRSSILSSSNKRKDYFASLPDEVLLMMFKYLPKTTLISCACVCRRWKRIAYDNDLWPRIDLSTRKLVPGSMAHVLLRGPQILRMAQTEVGTPIFKNLEETMEIHVSKIEFLDLSMASISVNDLKLLLKTCHILQKLSLENCEIDESVCKEIAKNDKLTVLNMSQCVGLNEAGAKEILSKCDKLVELNIAWTLLKSTSIKTICQYVPKDVQKINLSGCLKELTDAHVSTLVIRCHKLKELDLSDSTTISDTSVDAIYNNLKDLEILSLSRCYNILPASYTKLFMLPSIKHLNIFGLFHENQIESLRKSSEIKVNMLRFSSIARPTVGNKRTSIWNIRVRD